MNGTNTTKTPLLTIDITSDPICGFSYVAYRRVEQALNRLVQQHGPVKAIIRFHPYILDPGLPENGLVPRATRLKAVLGDRYAPFWESVVHAGLSCGIHFRGDAQMGQTIDAQRLLLYALKTLGPAAQFRLLGLLLRQHYDEARDITQHPPLAKLACSPIPCSDGVTRSLFPDEPTALEWLKSGALRYEVISSAKAAREHGIKASPMLVLNGKYAICGARDESIYYQAFEKAVTGEP
ncbi:hypothetical protein EHS25_001318 [Saitozyma podzolica]|uniref:DSBA-like thioredoxin domain-containing protein n=1 Tax=Saitozyma podzolica TaxID=1890683 RepID=A0A427YFN4_9TREE|nr:hypothetical protein EHS25_001318 [Saitozyma podzolica]